MFGILVFWRQNIGNKKCLSSCLYRVREQKWNYFWRNLPTSFLSLPGVNFINVLHTTFTLVDPESVKKIDNLTVFFMLLGSARERWWNWAQESISSTFYARVFITGISGVRFFFNFRVCSGHNVSIATTTQAVCILFQFLSSTTKTTNWSFLAEDKCWYFAEGTPFALNKVFKFCAKQKREIKHLRIFHSSEIATDYKVTRQFYRAFHGFGPQTRRLV